jgi:hypothetical protein
MSGTASAADTRLAYDVLLRGGYDSNLVLAVEDEIATARTIAGLTAKFDNDTERSAISADIEYQSLRFEDVPESNSNDYYIDLTASRFWERWTASLSGAVSSTNTLRTAVIETGLPEIGIQRERNALSSSLQYTASETSNYTLSASAEAVEFPDSTSFVDYDYLGAQFTRTNALSSRLSWFVGINYYELESPEVSSLSATAGVQGGMEWQVTETLSLTANAGRFRVESTRRFSFLGFEFERSAEDDGWTADIRLDQTWEKTRLILSVANNVQPNGNGFLNKQLSGQFDLFHDLSDRLQFRASYNQYRFDSLSALDGRPDDRDYQRASMRLSYRATERVLLGLEAAHTIQTVDRTGGTSDRDQIFASVTYRGGRQ